jgi:HD-like signal output (HDOD) protein
MGLFQRIRSALLGGSGGANTEADLQALLDGYELPSFPGIVMQVLATLRDPSASLATLATQLESDPKLHVEVLRLVNSAAFALTKEVTNLHRAVTLLGRTRLETLVLAQAVADALPPPPPRGFDMACFWLTAARRAFLARALATQLRSRNEVEAFTVGLLQDMAVPVLVARKGQDYIEAHQRWCEGDERPLDEVEREAVEIDHPTLGALMASRWGLPEYLRSAIALHHAEQRGEQLEAAVTFVADIRNDDEAEQLVARLVNELELSEAAATQLVEDAFEQAASFAEQLS